MAYNPKTEWEELSAKLPDVLAGRITDLWGLLGPATAGVALHFMVMLQQAMLEEHRKRMAELADQQN